MQKEILMYSANSQITTGDLKNLSGFKGSITIDDLQKTQDIFQKNNIKAFLMGSKDHHSKFHNIPSKPYIIHYMGDISLLDKNILGIVGTRKPSAYSSKVLRKLFEHAQNYDLVTISGMADGVDQLAHALSVKHNIPTIAVLGAGINHYLKGPQRHIIESILDNGGLIISEYKVDFKPTKYSFPQRNRIIAGLCDILFVGEAGEKSGSLITADFAYNISRPIYTVPNDIFLSTSVGINSLLASEKAKIIVDFEQFFDQNFQKIQTPKLSQKNISKLHGSQKQIIEHLMNSGELSLQQISVQTDLSIDELMQHITILEMEGYISQNSPGVYVIS